MNSTHLYLVSKQATPNLTPLMDSRISPDKVVLMVSPDMRERADWLAQVIKTQGIKTEHLEITDPWDISAIQESVYEWLIDFQDQSPAGQIMLNATGGTKPMSIAAYEVFRSLNLPIFYIHPETDHLVWMFHPNNEQGFDLEDRVKLDSFLRVSGYEVKPQQQPGGRIDHWFETAADVVNDITHYKSVIGSMNYLAATAQDTLKSEPLNRTHGYLDRLVELFEARGFLKIKDKCLVFPGEPERFFVNGGWLEFYVFEAIKKMRASHPEIQDIAMGLEVTRHQRGQQITNELDVAALANNRLYLVECKTARLSGKQNDSTNILYKLDSLTDIIGGLQARAMLASYRDVPDHDKTRAAELGIQICCAESLKNINSCLKKLMFS